MNQKELTKTFVKIKKLKKSIWLRCFFQNYFSALRVKDMFYFKNMDTQVQIITQKPMAVVDTSETVKSWQLNQPWRIVKAQFTVTGAGRRVFPPRGLSECHTPPRWKLAVYGATCRIFSAVKSACAAPDPSRHELLTQCWVNGGPASKTMCQH